MYNSNKIDDLRPDVAANCRVFLECCRRAGEAVLVVSTVRDEAFQLDAYAKGYSKLKRPSFHAQGVGLAFDFCQNIKGHGYDDLDFFARCGAIGEDVGFEWGGRWTSFPDRPHLQWSGAGQDLKSRDIWAGKRPGPMPLSPLAPIQLPAQPEEEDPMTQQEFEALLAKALDARRAQAAAQPPSDWAAEAWAAATADGLFDGSQPRAPLTREQAAVVLARLKK